jgi:pimeloyl-ACP methyl ester carboxylesterase
LRCARFDFSGIADSPHYDGQPENPDYDLEWLSDFTDVVAGVSPENPENVVLIGHCLGAYGAIETALAQRVQSVVAINPVLHLYRLHRRAELGDPRRRAARVIPPELLKLADKNKYVGHGLWRLWRQVCPSADPADVLAQVVESGAELLLLACEDDMRRFREGAYWRWFGLRRLSSTGRYRAEVVDELDHGMLGAVGRHRAMEILDEYVVHRFAPRNLRIQPDD